MERCIYTGRNHKNIGYCHTGYASLRWERKDKKQKTVLFLPDSDEEFSLLEVVEEKNIFYTNW